MKKMIKLVSFLTIGLVLILGLTACGNDEAELDTENGDVIIERPTPDIDVDSDQITLHYLNWNVGTEEENNIERQLIQAFMDEHPHINVVVDDSYVTAEGVDWNENLAILASTGDLPDVFMVSDIGIALNSGWALDITDLAYANPEFTNLPQNMQDAMAFRGGIYAIPLQQHMQGFFINLDTFEELNLDAPAYGFTIDELEDAIRSTTDLSVPRIGANTFAPMVDWYPGYANDDLGFFTFDGQNFHLDSPEMIDAFRLAQEWNSNGFAFYGLADEQRDMFNGDWHGEIFWNGEIALFFDGTWAANAINEYGDFDFKFIGIPGGRPIVVLDILSIASTTEHAEAAYLLANWMGSGTAGFTRRMELAGENGFTLAAQPITADQALIDSFFEAVGIEGIAEAYDNLDRALIDWNKITPGWVEARHNANTGVSIRHYADNNAPMGGLIWYGLQDGINFADYASRLNETLQEILDEIQASISD